MEALPIATSSLMCTITLAVLMWGHADSFEEKADEAVAGGVAKGEGNGLHRLGAVDKHNFCLVNLAVDDIFDGGVAGLFLETVRKIVGA